MRKEIGTVKISSGLFYVVDPCYIKSHAVLHKPDFDMRVFEKIVGDEKYDSLFGGVMGKIPIGTHSVFAHFDDDKDMKGAIKKLEIFVEVPEKDEKIKKVVLGKIGVDAGLIYFVDPRYIKDHSIICNDSEWQDFCVKYYANGGDKENFAQMCSGIICNTYNGDGEYPVIAHMNKIGRINKIEIDFLDDGID